MDPRLLDVPEEKFPPASSTSIERLMQQHRNIEQVLCLLDREADTIAQGESPDYLVVLAALHYLTEYIDHVHHPIEDAAFAVARKQCPEDRRDQLVHLSLEHDDLAFRGRQLRILLQEPLEDHVIRRDRAEQACREYTAYMRKHMRQEELNAFPLLQEQLSRQDWHRIEEVLAATSSDPLFGPIVEERYRELFRQLCSMNATDDQH